MAQKDSQPRNAVNRSSSASLKLIAPKLTVCMPTYNRGDLLHTLVTTILVILEPLFGSDFEIVVSNNHSQDNTRELISKLAKANPCVRLIQPPEHYPTGEENLCFALGECKGEYIWILGDDDSVEPATVKTLRDYVLKGAHDLIIFNSRSQSYYGQTIKDVRIPCLAPELDIPLLDFVRLTGFWFVISGFSTTVVRRASLDLGMFAKIMTIGKIYSQVTWLIGQFHDKPFVFVNQPLVSYRQNLSDVKPTGHWEHVAKREKLFPRAIWTNGFLRQLDFLVDKGVFAKEFVAEVVDRNLDKRFYFVDEVFLHMINTTIEWLDRKHQPIPPAECYYFLNWMKHLWPTNICFISALHKLYDSVFEDVQFDRASLDVTTGIINARIALPWYRHFHCYDSYGFSVYKHNGTWFAIRAGCDAEVRNWLEYIDFGDFEDMVLVSPSEQGLLSRLSQLPHGLRVKQAEQSPTQQMQDIFLALKDSLAAKATVIEVDTRQIDDLKHQLKTSIHDRDVEVAELKRQIAAWRERFQLHETRGEDLERQIRALKSSTSWKLTAPVRGVAGVFKS